MDDKLHNFEKKGIKAKKTLFLACFIPNHFNIAKTCRDVEITRQTFYRWCENPKFKQQIEELMEERSDMVEEAIFDNATIGKDTIAQIFLCKTLLKKRGYVEGEAVALRQKMDEDAVKLLSELIEGTQDVKTIALEFAKAGIPLPEPIKILLSKEPPEEDDTDDTAGILSEEELEERGRKAKEEHERQIGTFVPERQAEVQQMKEDLKDQDSFSDENIDPVNEGV